MVIMIVDLVDQLRFFVEATMGLTIGEIVSLTIGEAVSIETDVAIGFFELFL